jgi:hypothetical protein
MVRGAMSLGSLGLQARRTRGVSHFDFAIYIKKYLKEKRRIMETQIFHHANL